MKFEPTRQHLSFLFENFIKESGLLILALIISLATRGDSGEIADIAVLAIVLLTPLFKLIAYYFTIISVGNDMLVVQSGWLRKSRREIPIPGITTINLTQNIFHQLTGAYRMIINNSSNISESQEINITLPVDKALRLRSILTQEEGQAEADCSKEQGSTEVQNHAQGNTIEAGVLNLMLYGAFCSKWASVLKIFGALLVAIGFFGEVFEEAFGEFLDRVMESAGEEFGVFDSHIVWLTFIIGIFLWLMYIFAFSIVAGAITSLVRYCGFKVTDLGGELHIDYGIITKKSYKFDKAKIVGFRYEQTLLMRLFKVGMLKCIAVGYGWGDSDVSQEEPMMIPLVRLSELDDVMASFIPELSERSEAVKPEPRFAYYFLLRPIFVFCILLATAAVIAGVEVDAAFYLLAAAIMLFGLANITMQFYTTSISSNAENVRVCSGGFSKTTTCLKTDSIESVRDMASALKRRRGAAHIVIGYFAKNGVAVATNVSTQAADRLIGLLKY
ncbi:MAG: PH domain-containing protein [Mogibacterium sp.]|nr:PH domain-containing protein [Mogibacterium sp.]